MFGHPAERCFIIPIGLFDEVPRDFADETGRKVEIWLAVSHPLSGTGQRQFFHGSCDADIAQSAFFFHLFRRGVVDCHRTGEYAFFHAANVYVWEFESFGAVQRHEENLLGVVVQCVDIRDERDVF